MEQVRGNVVKLRLLLPIRHSTSDGELILGMRLHQMAIRIGPAARQADLLVRATGATALSWA